MAEHGDVEYEYQGRAWTLPAALIALQIQLVKADAECERWLDDPDRLAAARAERLRLVEEKFRRARSWWEGFENYDRWRADWALKEYAAKRAAEAEHSPSPEH